MVSLDGNSKQDVTRYYFYRRLDFLEILFRPEFYWQNIF